MDTLSRRELCGNRGRDMDDEARVLVAYVVDEALCRTVERAARGKARVVYAPTAQALPHMVSGESVDGVFVDLSRPDAELDALVLALGLRTTPMPVLIYTPLVPSRARDVVRLAQRCPTSVILMGHDDVAAGIEKFAHDTFKTLSAVAVVKDLVDEVAPDARLVMECCLSRLERPPTVREVSRMIGISERSLARRVRRSCDMGAEELLTRTRLLVAVWLIHATRLSLGQVANATGFADATSLSHALQRHFRLRSQGLRRRGSFPAFLVDVRSRFPRWLEEDAARDVAN